MSDEVDTPEAVTATLDVRRFITAMYDLFLGRGADADGYASKRDRLIARTLSPEELVIELALSAEFADRIPQFLHRLGASHSRGLLNDVTQYGELQLLLRTWVNSSAKSRYVVDVGARGRDRSNSYDLLRHFGWRGLLVEANPTLIEPLRTEFDGLEVEIANYAISDFNGRARLTLGGNDDVSSLTAAAAEGWGETRGQVEVVVRRLPDLLEEYGAPAEPDLMSIDIEGEDIRVLNDLVQDDRYRPQWIFIEASHDFDTGSLADLKTHAAVQDRYTLVGQTKANLLLRRTG